MTCCAISRCSMFDRLIADAHHIVDHGLAAAAEDIVGVILE